MPRSLLLGMLAILLFGSGCQRFQRNFDSVASLCDVDPASIQADEFFIKWETPKGEELSPEMLFTTSSRFLADSRRTDILTISPRGCVRVKAESGVAQAFSMAQGWSASLVFNEPSPRQLVRVPLTNSPRVSAELQCPATGFFVHESLAFPLRWSSDGPMHAARLMLTAVDAAQGKSYVLFEKPYGLHLASLPDEIRTADLPEGSYQLQLSFQLSTEGWDQRGPVPSRVESCPLVILHNRPKLGGLDGYALEQRVAVFAKGQALPWKTDSAQSELVHCREKRGQDADELGADVAGESCEPRAECREPKNFQKTGAIVPDELGVFDYYAYAEDKAGNRSAMSCQTVVVTESKPELKLLWADSSWDKPAAQMQTPRWEVQLRVVATHPQLADASLTNRYQCKAEFLRDDQSLLSGRSVVCTSGRCRNRSLEDFIPCDADLNLSLAELWPHLTREGGVLRVFIRADDGVGHVQEQLAAVGMQPHRWAPKRLSPTTNLEDHVRQLLQDKAGRIFAIQGYNILQIKENATQGEALRLPDPVQDSEILQAWLSQEGELHAQWRYRPLGASADAFHIFRRSGEAWEPLPGPAASGLGTGQEIECRNPQSFHRGGFWCSTAAGPAVYHKNQWTILPLGNEAAPCLVLPQRQNLVQDQQQNFWLQCNDQLLQKPAGHDSWIQHEHPLPLVNIGMDGKERFWILRGTERDDMIIQLSEGGASRNLPLPETFNWIHLRAEEFRIGPASQVVLGDSYWDESRNAWQVFPYFTHRRVDQRVFPHFTSQGELYWETEQGFMQWDGSGLRLWDLKSYGLSFGSGLQVASRENSAPIILASPGGSYTFPYQYQMKPWHYFPKPGSSAQSRIVGLWADADSTPQVYVVNEGLYELEFGRWTRTLHSPDLEDELPLDTPTFEPILMSSKGIYRYSQDRGWRRMVRFPEPRTYWGGARDKLGRFWVYQDSMELGLIDGDQFFQVPLPAGAGTEIRGLYSRHDGVLAATDVGLVSRREGETEWTIRTWKDWDLESIERIRQIDDDHYFVSVLDEFGAISAFWMLDMSNGTKQSFEVPPNSYHFMDIYRTTKGDYILVIKFDIYRTDGKSYDKIFSEKDLYSLSETSGTFLNIFNLNVDVNDRLWFETMYGIVRIDL